MTARRKSRKSKKPKGTLSCDWCTKTDLNERGLQAHVRVMHLEHIEEAKQAAEARSEAARLQEPAQEARTVAEQNTVPNAHSHPTMDGSHTHEWGDQRHEHPTGGGPPQFAPVAPHPGLSNPEGLAKTGAPMVATDRPGEEKDEATKAREHAAAIEASKRVQEEARDSYPTISDPDGDILIHVVHDGFTVLGKVWVYGEEIRLKRGSKKYNETFDAEGKSWLDMTEDEQIKRYHAIMFRHGPFPGRRTPMTEDEYTAALLNASPEEARRLEKMRQRNQLPVDAPVAASRLA